MGILQTSPAKVTCMYFCRSNYKLVSFFSFLFFNSERVIFPRETLRKSISISRVVCSMKELIANDPA